MMNKKVVLVLLVSLSISITGCGNKQDIDPHSGIVESENSEKSQSNSPTNDITYVLNEDVYTNKNITIKYPQVINLDNKNKQNTINELIRNEVLADFTNVVDENLDLKLDYEIELESADVLSITYSGVGYYKGASRPNNWFFTTNIDMKSGKKVKLSHIIKIDENFVRVFKNGKYISYERMDKSQGNKELEQAVTEYINNIDSNDLIKYFNQSDSRSIKENPSSVFSYITKESIVISISVPHAIGDHAEYKVDYRDIKGNLNINEFMYKLINN